MSSRETTEKGYYWDVRRARLPDFWIKRVDTMQISKVPKVTAVPSVAWVSKPPRLPRVPQALMFLSVPEITNAPKVPRVSFFIGSYFPRKVSVQACSLWVCTDTQGPFKFQSTERSIRTFFASLAISTLTNFENGLVPVP